jgi:hypothetical protein
MAPHLQRGNGPDTMLRGIRGSIDVKISAVTQVGVMAHTSCHFRWNRGVAV